MKKNYRILNSLFWLLVSFNIAALLFSLAFSQRKTQFSHGGDFFSYYFNSREWPAFPWMSLAALVLSIGIWVFVSDWLETQE